MVHEKQRLMLFSPYDSSAIDGASCVGSIFPHYTIPLSAWRNARRIQREVSGTSDIWSGIHWLIDMALEKGPVCLRQESSFQGGFNRDKRGN